ncbi:MAG: MFS transporter [Candidatus Bathyarchaeota archaeon]|nr:MAG: MFS transporter [Candidatus Bathyarchaeota archaeon]
MGKRFIPQSYMRQGIHDLQESSEFEGEATATSKKNFSVYTDRTMILLFVVSFVTTLGMSSINSIWPLYIISLGATVLQAGYVISLSGVVATILTGFSGVISDRFGRKRVILASIILAIISPLLYIRTEGWQELFLLGPLYASVFSLFMPTRNAWIADLVEPEKRSAAYSFLFLALPTAGVVGPTLGGMIVDSLGWQTLFMVVAVVHGLSILPIIVIGDSGKPSTEPEETSFEAAGEQGQTKVVFLMILLWFVLGLGSGTVNTTIPLYLTEKLKSTKTQIGIFTSIGFGVTGAVSQLLSAKLTDKLGKRRFLLYCCLAIPLTYLAWPSRTTYMELLALRMIGMAAWTASWSPAVATLMEASPTRKRGLYSGLFEASVRFGMTVGPTLAGILWENWGSYSPFYTASLIFAVSVPIALLVERSQS